MPNKEKNFFNESFKIRKRKQNDLLEKKEMETYSKYSNQNLPISLPKSLKLQKEYSETNVKSFNLDLRKITTLELTNQGSTSKYEQESNPIVINISQNVENNNENNLNIICNNYIQKLEKQVQHLIYQLSQNKQILEKYESQMKNLENNYNDLFNNIQNNWNGNTF